MSKPPSPAFQPAPRPQKRVSPEQAQALAAETGDLGFTRPSSAPSEKPESPSAPERQIPHSQKGKSPLAHVKPATLKFEIPEAVWTALRLAAVERRVTVRYLVLEALAEKGYNIDLSSIPEDGRRVR